MSNEIIIRKLKEDDLEQLALLYEEFWNEPSDVRKMRRSFRSLKENRNYYFIIASEGERVIGAITGVICEELYGDCRPFMLVEDFIVQKKYRRRGIGRMLLKKVENYARKRHCCAITLVTDSERTDAQQFYQSTGFSGDTHKGYKKSLD